MADDAITVESDVDAYDKIIAALEHVPIVRESRPLVQVNVAHGVATLTGIAHSLIMRRAIVYTVAAVPGVHKVIDQMMDDTQIDNAVAQRLAAEPSLKDRQAQMTVNSYRGVVTVTGVGLSEADCNKAKEIIALLPGVRDVVIHAG